MGINQIFHRSTNDVAKWTELDFPIVRFRRYLERQGWWDEEADKNWLKQVFIQVYKNKLGSYF